MHIRGAHGACLTRTAVAVLALLSTATVLGTGRASAGSLAGTGSWVRVAEPSLGPEFLNGITCTSAHNCWAVGDSASGATIDLWGGASWRKVAGGTASGTLYTVSCVEASDCWAVGSVQVGTVSQTLTEHWNGRTWARVPSPTPPFPGEGDALEGVSCQSVASCWAVGTGGIGPATHHSIILHWTGVTWSVVTPPPGPVAPLLAVSCTHSTSCWAVGTGGIDRLSGSRWTYVPDPASAAVWLEGVSCESADSCFAVGYLSASAYVLQWNGSTWTHVASAGPPGPGSCTPTVSNPCSPVSVAQQAASVDDLTGVSCRATLGCVLTGDLESGQTWSERWSGSALVGIATAPSPGPATLHGIICPTSRECLAVGGYGSGSGSALFERFTA